jgi:hypothetical protein
MGQALGDIGSGLYAIIGIVVAFLAFAAINFLTQQLMQTT